MIFATPEFAGPHAPAVGTPVRMPRSIRRTTSIDCLRPDGLMGDLVVDARGRDLRTGSHGGHDIEQVRLDLRLEGPTRRILSLRSDRDEEAWQPLVGRTVGPGFRGLVTDLAAGQERPSSLVCLLLDDLVGASLVSGYSQLHGGALEPPDPARAARRTVGSAMTERSDLCAGWAREGSFMVTLRTEGRTPTPLGPPAPALERPDDPVAWHPMASLPPHGVRRRRRLDLVAPVDPDAPAVALAPAGPGGSPDRGAGPAGADPSEGAWALDVVFRDTHVDGDGAETVVHEYGVTGSVDRAGRLVDVAAEAHVLPWMECPAAVASAQRLVGAPVSDLRRVVRRDFVGVTTCTHLNDTLRGLADLAVLLERLETVA